MTALKPYPSYKASGVEWLGQVPLHWEVRQLGRIGRFSKGSGGTKEDESEHGVPCIRYGDLYTQHQFFITESKTFVTRRLAAIYTPIRYRDVLFAGSGETIDEIGKSAVNLIRGPACCGGDVIIFRPSIDVDARFLGYATDCPQAVHQKACMGRGITVMHIYWSYLKYMAVAFPPLPEQATITRFLDHADRRIRRYIRAKQELIDLLEEQKQKTIHRAVTQGLGSDVRRKPSGVDWLGDVPEHWAIRRAKFFYRQIDERSSDGTEELMSVSHKTGITPRKSNVTMFMAKSHKGYKLCRPGDIVINTMWAYMAALGVARQKGLVSPSYGVYRPLHHRRFNQEYIDYLLRTELYRNEYVTRSTGITASRLRLYPESFLTIPLLCPPYAEQTTIVEYIDEITARADATINRTRRQIELLREYRIRLIADVVTGKLDVRNVDILAHDKESAFDDIDDVEYRSVPDGVDVMAKLNGDD